MYENWYKDWTVRVNPVESEANRKAREATEETFKRYYKELITDVASTAPVELDKNGMFVNKDGGKKDKAGKLRWDLLPFTGLREAVKVFTYGAEKYGAGNWKNGLLYSDCVAALMRHLDKWRAGEKNDLENNAHHLGSVIFWCLVLIVFDNNARYKFYDDRGKYD
jgi:hypothetical protein